MAAHSLSFQAGRFRHNTVQEQRKTVKRLPYKMLIVPLPLGPETHPDTVGRELGATRLIEWRSCLSKMLSTKPDQG